MSPSGCGRSRERLSGRARDIFFGGWPERTFGSANLRVRPVCDAGCSVPGRITPLGHYCRRGNSRTGPGEEPQGSRRDRERPSNLAFVNAPERRPFDLSGSGGKSAGGQGSGSRARGVGMTLERRRNPREHRSGRTSVRAATDPRREQGPEAAGHRGLLVLRAEECDVKNSMGARKPKGERLCEGGKL